MKKKFGSGIAVNGSPTNLKDGSCKANALSMEQAMTMETAGARGAGGTKKGALRKKDLREVPVGGGKNFPRM